VFKLPAEMTIAQMASCKTQILQFIDENDEVSFDDSEINRVDTLGVQLLLAIVFYINAQNKVLNWQIESEILKQSIAQLGVDDEIINKHLNV
jgi:ABC-type transporter Mla MlaB component